MFKKKSKGIKKETYKNKDTSTQQNKNKIHNHPIHQIANNKPTLICKKPKREIKHKKLVKIVNQKLQLKQDQFRLKNLIFFRTKLFIKKYNKISKS